MIISFMWDLQACCDLTCKNKNVGFLLQDKSCELIVGFFPNMEIKSEKMTFCVNYIYHCGFESFSLSFRDHVSCVVGNPGCGVVPYHSMPDEKS